MKRGYVNSFDHLVQANQAGLAPFLDRCKALTEARACAVAELSWDKRDLRWGVRLRRMELVLRSGTTLTP
eukprot:6193627-Pleurochrysis_carterae.AAC.2